MALLWVDGFEKYGTVNAAINPSTILNWKYKAIASTLADMVPGRHGGKALRIDSLSMYLETPDVGTGADTLICGFNFKLRDCDNGSWICDFRQPRSDGETIGYNQLTFKCVSVNSANQIRAIRGGTTLNTSTTVDLQTDTWYHFEAKVKCDNTNGTINVYLDGSEVLTFTGNTKHRNVGPDTFSRVLWNTGVADALTIDDLYIMDTSGSKNNDALQDDTTRVEALSPTSDVSGNWTASTGSDLYAMVDEDQQDANYIKDDTTGNRAIFEMTNLSANAASGNVNGVMISCDSQQTSRFTKYAKALTQNGSGGTVQHSGNFAPGNTNPLCHTFIMEDDPDGNAWSAATVNSLRTGVEVS